MFVCGTFRGFVVPSRSRRLLGSGVFAKAANSVGGLLLYLLLRYAIVHHAKKHYVCCDASCGSSRDRQTKPARADFLASHAAFPFLPQFTAHQMMSDTLR